MVSDNENISVFGAKFALFGVWHWKQSTCFDNLMTITIRRIRADQLSVLAFGNNNEFIGRFISYKTQWYYEYIYFSLFAKKWKSLPLRVKMHIATVIHDYGYGKKTAESKRVFCNHMNCTMCAWMRSGFFTILIKVAILCLKFLISVVIIWTNGFESLHQRISLN